MKSLLYAIVLLFGLVGLCHGDVVVFDRLTPKGKAVYLKVLTTSHFFFAAGGRRVDLFVDGKKLQQILTGGDGYGYLKYTPRDAGLMRIEARTDTGSSAGLLLVLEPDDRAICIEIEGAFRQSLFSEEKMTESRHALESLNRTFHIIYISRYFSTDMTRKWLRKERFPEAVILKWQGPEMFQQLKDKGIQVHAVIGSATFVSAAAGHVTNRYTFEESKDGLTVTGWEQVLTSLQKDEVGTRAK